MIKKFYSCFLFGKTADTHKVWFWVWNGAFIFLSACLTTALSLSLAYGNYSPEIFKGYFTHPEIFALNLLPVLLLMLAVYFLTGRAWIAYLAVSAPVLASAIADYYKLRFRDDPFIAADIPAITTGLKMSGQYDVTVAKRVLFVIIAFVLCTLFLAFFVRGRFRFRFRLIGLAVALIAIWPSYKLLTSDAVFNGITNFDYPGANVWSETQRQITRGFVYPFIHSIPDAIPQKPDGYSDKTALEALSGYTAEDIPDDRKVNVIGIQLEAFNDFTRLGVEGIAPSVYEKYHALEAESYTGNLVTNIFAGGTIDTERCFLTGYTELDDFRSDVGSYVRYFREQGYRAEGCHSSYAWFYNRQNVNRYMGFEDYWFIENRYEEKTGGGVGYDELLIPDIMTLYRERDKSVPYFNFSVTYQGHGPYAKDSFYTWVDGNWQDRSVSEESWFILNNYFSSLQNTSDYLCEFIDGLRRDSAPVVVIVFGDHNPWLGDGNSVYNELGINLDVSTEEGFYNYYSTRYLIWANDAAKKALGTDMTGEGPTVSPCFLMNVLFEACGWGRGSAYMQLMSDVMKLTPVVNTAGFCVENGEVTREPSEGIRKALEYQSIAQYYRKRHVEW